MAAYGSIATNSKTNGAGGADTIVVTKPASLAAGDCMIAAIAVRSASQPTSTGFTALTNAGDANRRLYILVKVATSGDAAASDFTFNYNTSTNAPIAVALIRVTGTFTGVDNLLYSLDNNAAATTHTFTPGITPTTTSNLLIMGAYGTEAGVTQSAYAITNDNPSWTERADFTQAATGDDASLSVATATPSAATATGDFNITLSSSTEAIGYILSILDSTNVTVSPAVVVVNASVQAPAVAAGASVTISSPIVANASVQAPTVTTAAPKWTNPDKSSAGTITNPDKSV